MSIKKQSGSKIDHFLFFSEDLSLPVTYLTSTESKHILSVLRLTKGDHLFLTDGKGGTAEGVLEIGGSNGCVARIIQREYRPRSQPVVTLVLGIPERDAFESVLTDATALGVHTIQPVSTDYTQKAWWKRRWEKLLPRFTQKMVTALKQSHNHYLPELLPPVPLHTLPPPLTKQCMVADCNGTPLLSALSGTGPFTIAIGPPGGFSEQELQLFLKQSFITVKIAPARLRTELATTVTLSQLTGATLSTT